MNLSMRDWIWIMGIVAGIATTYGMMSSRVSALESKIKDIDMLRIYARLSVIEIMENTIPLRVPSKIDCEMGPSWGEVG